MKILYLPIDITIPVFDISKLHSSVYTGARYQPYWRTEDISQIQYPELFEVIDQLPFIKVTNIYFKEQKEFVKAHYDVYPDMTFEDGEYQNILSNEPAGYRIVLIGKKDKIFIKSKGKFKPAVLPTVPGCYLINSTESYHMVLNDSGRKIIYVRGLIDPEKHKALIDRSFNLYKDLAIIEED